MLKYLEAHGGSRLAVEVRISCLDNTIPGSYRWTNIDDNSDDAHDIRLMEADVYEERQNFVAEVQELALNVCAWERQQDGSTVTIVEHKRQKGSLGRIRSWR